MRDEWFIRGEVPMNLKEQKVRAVSIGEAGAFARFGLYDIGGGDWTFHVGGGHAAFYAGKARSMQSKSGRPWSCWRKTGKKFQAGAEFES